MAATATATKLQHAQSKSKTLTITFKNAIRQFTLKEVRAMWPFGSGRRAGKTVAENRTQKDKQIVQVASRISQLQSRIVWIEHNAPYEKNDRKRKKLEIEKLQIEEKIKALERQHHSLAAGIKG